MLNFVLMRSAFCRGVHRNGIFGFGCARIETRALLLAPFFTLSLTLVPRSLLQDRTETLASQVTKSGSFTIYRNTHYHALSANLENNATSDVLRVF